MVEVHRLLHIYLTIPLTSATAERTFSALRQLKSYLRSTMTQKTSESHAPPSRTQSANG